MIPMARSAELRSGSQLREIKPATRWSLRERLTELVGNGNLSVAAAEILQMQREEETCAWIQMGEPCSFFPPDFERAGIDLEHLAIIRVNHDLVSLFRAAELLLRSGAFGLVVLDLDERQTRRFNPATLRRGLSRLHALVREHSAAVLLLTEEPLCNPLISIRIRPIRKCEPTTASIEAEVLRNKAGVSPSAMRFALPLDLITNPPIQLELPVATQREMTPPTELVVVDSPPPELQLAAQPQELHACA